MGFMEEAGYGRREPKTRWEEVDDRQSKVKSDESEVFGSGGVIYCQGGSPAAGIGQRTTLRRLDAALALASILRVNQEIVIDVDLGSADLHDRSNERAVRLPLETGSRARQVESWFMS
jgi:hypothetical protein